MPETNSHVTPELLICAPGDLIMRNLAYTAVLLEWRAYSCHWSVWNFLLLVCLSSWVEGMLVLGHCPSFYVTYWIFHVSNAFQGSTKHALFPFVAAHRVFRFKDLLTSPFLHFTEGVLTRTLLTWTIWRAPTSASKWRVGFNAPFKGLIYFYLFSNTTRYIK